MTTLRITQSTTGEDRYRVDLRLEGEGQAPLAATADFCFRMTEQDQEDLRWYLEDYLQFPFDPAPTVAARVETRMAEIGRSSTIPRSRSSPRSRRPRRSPGS